MFARQIADESESRGFLCDRVVDLQDVVDNDDYLPQRPNHPSLAYGGDGGEDDVEGALIRATLAHPRHRAGGGGGGGGENDDDENDGGKRSRAVFLVATYGEGEPTDNAQQFVEIMKRKSGIFNIYKVGTPAAVGGRGGNDNNGEVGEEKKGEEEEEESGDIAKTGGGTPHEFLRDVDYAVFGLGNRQYEHYNNMGRFVDASLGMCGARRVAALGLGDDDDDLEGDFETWK